MNAQKALVLFVGAVVIVGIIFFQLRRARPAMPVTADATAEVPAQLPEPVAASAPSSTTSAFTPQESGGMEPVSIPSGWGRNPFLTPKEIEDLNPPPPQIVEVEPPPPTPPPPPPLPRYRVMAIVTNQNGALALIDTIGSVRVGDLIGKERVTAITPEAVVLEQDGKTRELALGASAAATASKGDATP